MYALRSVGVHVVQVAFLRLLVRGGFVDVMFVLRRGVVGGEWGGHWWTGGQFRGWHGDVGKIGGVVVVV